MATQAAALESAEPQASLSEARPLARPRLQYLDNLRMVLITIVVLGHLAVTYGAAADWYYLEAGEASLVASILLVMVSALGIGFGMGLFFLIAGYFTPPAYERRRARRFLVDRLKRLGIPWLIFEVIINPLLHYAVDVHDGGNCTGAFYDCQYQGSVWQYLAEYPRNIGSFASSPVWFLEALLIFSFCYAAWRLVTGQVAARRSGDPHRAHPVPGNGSITLFALAIGLSSFVVRFWASAGVYFEPFHFELARFPQYIALFVAGVWVYRHGWLAAFSDRQARMWGWVTLACVLTLPALAVAAGALAGSIDEQIFGGVNWLSLAYSLWEGILCVSMSITMLAWFRRRFDHQGRLARAMSESAFAVYILHPAIIVPLALALSGVQLNLSVKYLIVAPIAVALCYLVAYGLRKVPLVRMVLG